MSVIPTKVLFDKFFEGKDPETVRKTRAQVDRPEVYAYEAKIGKQLVDMNEDELFEMICSFHNKKSAVREGLKCKFRPNGVVFSLWAVYVFRFKRCGSFG